jgi:hypothetical protein
LVDALFHQAGRGIDMMAAGRKIQDAAAYKAELNRLAALKPLQFTVVRFEGYDAQLHRTACAATISIVVPPGDRSPTAKEAAHHVGFPPDTPEDLLGASPETDITYAIQPSPDGHGSVVTSDQTHPTTSALLALAGLQYVVHGGQ